jgi:hypothetical protein
MHKIERLETVHTRLAIRRQYFVFRLLRLDQYAFTPETFEEYTKSVGQATVMQAEIEDHCSSLRAIEAACHHGLNGTIPEGYAEDGYEFTEDPETPLQPYDAYTDILGYLHGGANVSCLVLSPPLRRFIELLPTVAAECAERDLHARDGVLLHVNDDGSTRPMTMDELQRRGDHKLLDALEDSLFAETYAQELQQIQRLAEQRGDLQQILALL